MAETKRRRSLYRRAADWPPEIDRPTVVQSRGDRRVPYADRRWLVVSRTPIPGEPNVFGRASGFYIATAGSHSDGVALAAAAAVSSGVVPAGGATDG